MGEFVLTLSSAFLLGFMGSAHCLGMCGGLAGALGLSTFSTNPAVPRMPEFDYARFFTLSSYNLGRISSYTVAGLLIGLFGLWLGQYLLLLEGLRYAAAVLLIFLGLYIGQWFNGLILVERAGSRIWQAIKPLGQRFMPPKNRAQAFALGMVWGWLPCGLVYSALIWASTQAHPLHAALVMFCFGLGTLPSMLLTGVFAQQIMQTLKSARFRQFSGLMMIGFGCWSLPLVQRFILL